LGQYQLGEPFCWPVAQWLEQVLYKRQVAGSSPAWPTLGGFVINIKLHMLFLFFVSSIIAALIFWAYNLDKHTADNCESHGGQFFARGNVCIDKKSIIRIDQ
jgi:hypothetical protein